MPTSVVSAWLATPRPPSGTVPSRPTMAESASRNSGSATSAPNAGTASRRISASCGLCSPARSRRIRSSANHAPGTQVGDVGCCQAETGQHRVGVLRRVSAAPRLGSGRSSESRRRGWLSDAADVDERASGRRVRVRWCLGHAQDWRDAGVGAGEYLLPLRPGARRRRPRRIAAAAPASRPGRCWRGKPGARQVRDRAAARRRTAAPARRRPRTGRPRWHRCRRTALRRPAG